MTFYRTITYVVQYTPGPDAGKIWVQKAPTSPVRWSSSGELIKHDRPPQVRTWPITQGLGVAVDLVVPREQANYGHDHWDEAERALRERFPDAEIEFTP